MTGEKGQSLPAIPGVQNFAPAVILVTMHYTFLEVLIAKLLGCE